MKKKIKILIYTGSRANYSSTKPLISAAKALNKFKIINVLGGSAHLEKYGNLVEDFKKNNNKVSDYFYLNIEGSSTLSMSQSTGLGILNFSPILKKHNPDIVLVVGDRFDVLSVVIASSLMNKYICHTMGGELSGTIDENIRHAITKLSHLHFPANANAKKRLIQMGEEKSNIFNYGCPRIDYIKKILENKNFYLENFFHYCKGIGEIFDIRKEKFFVILFHPVTTEYGKNRGYIEKILNAVKDLGQKVIMLWPNMDADSDNISKGIRTFREKHKPNWLIIYKNIPFEYYISLLSQTTCLIGNSSSGIREGAYIGTPVVNIGTRQRNRLRDRNTLDVRYDELEIKKAIIKQSKAKYKKSNAYGKGNASIKILKKISDYKDFNIDKNFSDL